MMAFQSPLALVMKEISGPGLLDYAVENMGKVFLCAEVGGAGMLAPATVNITEVGARNLLKHFGVIEGEPLSRERRGLSPMQLMEIPDADCYQMALSAGIYESFYELGDRVEAGQPLGQIHFVQDPLREAAVLGAMRSGLLVGRRGPGGVAVGVVVGVVAMETGD